MDSLTNISQAFGQFLVWTAQTAREKGAKQICFVSREGVWLAGRYEAMRAQTRCPDEFPVARHLAVSRRSTYLASFEAIGPDLLEPIIAQYRTPSVHAVLIGLGLTEQDFQSKILQSAGLSAILQESWQQEDRFARLLENGPLADFLEVRRATQRDYLLRYLVQENMLHKEAGPSFLADVGWRGSIQDNLARLLPENRLNGLYFHLQPFLVPQQKNVTKVAFLAPTKHRILRRLRFGAPLEFLVCGNEPTVSGYTADQDDGVRPVLDQAELIPRDRQTALEGLQADMAESIQLCTFDTLPVPAKALTQTLAFLERPPETVSTLYLVSRRDERFGTGRIYMPNARLRWRDVLAALLYNKKRRALIHQLAESGWPWAILQRDIPFIACFVQFFLLSFDLSARQRNVCGITSHRTKSSFGKGWKHRNEHRGKPPY